MNAQQLLKTYGIEYTNKKEITFERMLETVRKLHELDPLIFKHCPFLEDSTQLTEDAWGIFEQCVAIEKGWAN